MLATTKHNDAKNRSAIRFARRESQYETSEITHTVRFVGIAAAKSGAQRPNATDYGYQRALHNGYGSAACQGTASDRKCSRSRHLGKLRRRAPVNSARFRGYCT